MSNKTDKQYSRNTFILIFIFVLILSYQIVYSFLLAVLIGGVLAHALKPIQQNRFFKIFSKNKAAYLTIAGFIIIVIIPLAFFTTSLINQAIQFEKYLSFHEAISFSSLIESISKWPIINHFADNPIQLQNKIKIFTTEIGTTISSTALKQAAKIPSLIIQTILTLLSCLVFLTEGEKFTCWLSDKIPLDNEIKNSLLQSFSHSSKIAIWASLGASGAQAITIFIGFLSLNIPAAILATGATFIFAFIPFLGASPVWILGAIYLYLQGSFIKFICNRTA